MSSRIATARNELATYIDELEAAGLSAIQARLRDILASLNPNKRQPNASVRRGYSVKLTPELAAQIRAYRAANPEARQVDIGAAFRVHQGDVSAILNDRLFPRGT